MENQELNSNDEIISWNFAEFSNKDRKNSWYVWYGIILSALIIYALFADNFLFAIILILFSLIIFLQNWRKPDQIHFAISARGINIGNSFYSMIDIEEFWLAYKPPEVKMLFIEFKAGWKPSLGIPLENQDPLQVREILLDFLPENLDNEDEPLPDTIARILNL